VLLLLSDAAAAWYLMLLEKDEQARCSFDLLLSSPDDELTRFFESERTAGRLKDDDIAVLRIEIYGSARAND
jgi:hypothetical protein